MATKDFRTDRLRGLKIVASGSKGAPGLIIHSSSWATKGGVTGEANYDGTTTNPITGRGVYDGGGAATMLGTVGRDVELFVSGARHQKARHVDPGVHVAADGGVTLVGGDLVVSGAIYSGGGTLIEADVDWTDGGHKLVTTSSVSIDARAKFADAADLGKYTTDGGASWTDYPMKDAYFWVSGAKGAHARRLSSPPGAWTSARTVSVFGGDVVISGTLYAEKQVIEVDENVTGSLWVSGSLFVSRSLNVNQGATINLSSDGPFGYSDFQVKSDNRDYILYVDASSDKVGVGGPAAPLATLHIESGSTTNVNADLSDAGNYHFLATTAVNTIGRGIGLGFRVGTNPADVGAAITHTRQGSRGKGDLRFYVKTDSGGAVAPEFVMDLRASRQVFVLSGAIAGSPYDTTSPNPEVYEDTNFFVSGGIGYKDGARYGVAVFGGDVVISGTLHGGSPLLIGTDTRLSGAYQSTQYFNFGGPQPDGTPNPDGLTGYGFRSNAGTMEFKDAAGAWETFTSHGAMTSWTLAGDTGTPQTINDTNTATIVGGTGIDTDAAVGDTLTVNLADTLVTPLTYGDATNVPRLTVDQQGRITGVTNVTIAIAAAPDDAQYVTLATDGTLTNERVLTEGDGLTITDAGAGSTVTVEIDYAGTDNFINVQSTTATPVAGDMILFHDLDDTNVKKCTVGDLPFGAGTMTSFTLAGDTGATPTVSDGNTLTIAGGSGLTTDGVVPDQVDIEFDIPGLGSLGGTPDAADTFIVYDDDVSTTKKVTYTNLMAGAASGIEWDGSTANGVGTFKNADEATVEANLTFDGDTLQATCATNTIAGSVQIDRDFSGVIGIGDGATDPAGLLVDYDVTGVVAAGQTQYHDAITVKYNQDSPTMHGTSTVVGTGVKVNIAGGTSGNQSVIGANITVTGGDTNIGLFVDAPPGTIEGDVNSSHIRCKSSADAGDYFDVSVGADGLTQLTTRDSAGAQAHLNIKPDGKVLILSGAGIPGPLSPNEALFQDVNFFVSGTTNARGTTTQGTALFGGDLVISGGITVGNAPSSPVPPGTMEVWNASNPIARFTNTAPNLGGGVVRLENNRDGGNGQVDDFAGGVELYAQDNAGNTTQYAKISSKIISPVNGAEKGSLTFETATQVANKGTPLYLRGDRVHVLSGGAYASFDEASAGDVSFYVSGTVGSKDSGVRGTSLFGGDVVVSGTLWGAPAGGLPAAMLSIGQDAIIEGANASTQYVNFGATRFATGYGFRSNAGAMEFKDNSGAWTAFGTGAGTMSSWTLAGDSGTQAVVEADTATFTGGTGIDTIAAATDTLTINLADTAVTPNAYTNANITVDQQGRITLAADGVASSEWTDEGDILRPNEAVGDSVGIGATGNISTAYPIFLNKDGGAIFNQLKGATGDFIVSSDNNTDMFKVDVSSDRIGIGTIAIPATTVHIKESAPTLRIQRSNNANNSTIEFVGSAGSTANMVHLAASNDLVFSTHDGSDQEEILRLGSHYGSSNRQVILLSGSDVAASSMQPKQSTDINFFVSGSVGSRTTATKGTSVFGGDTVVSGTLVGNRSDAGAHAAIKIDKNYTGVMSVGNYINDASGLLVDYDVTGIVAGGQTAVHDAIAVNFNQDAPTHVGTLNSTGLDVRMTGGTSGNQTMKGMAIKLAGADSNIGIDIEVPDGNTHFIARSSASILDYFSISVGTNATTTLTTNDNGGTAGDIAIVANGEVIVDSTEDRVLILSGGSAHSVNEASAGDISFYVSGAIGNTSNMLPKSRKAVFGGDLVVSGGLRVEGGNPGGATIATISAVAQDSFLEFRNANVLKSYLKQGSGGTFFVTNNATGGDIVLEADAGTEFLRLDGLTDKTIAAQPIRGLLGLSGSLTRLHDDTSYIIAGTGINVSSASNGAITIAATSGGSEWTDIGNWLHPTEITDGVIVGAVNVVDADILLKPEGGAVFNQQGLNTAASSFTIQTNTKPTAFTTDAATDQVLILSGGNSLSPDEAMGEDVAFYVSGSVRPPLNSNRYMSVFGGDTYVSGALSVQGITTINNLQNAAADFVVKTLTKPDALFVDAANDKIGIFTSTPTNDVHVVGTADTSFGLEQNSANIDSFNLTFKKSRGSFASPTTVLDGDELGEIWFMGHDGTNYETGAKISAYVDGAPGGDPTDMPGRLRLETTPDGDDVPIARVDIRANGYVLINSGSGASASPNELLFTDTNFFVSGSRDARFSGVADPDRVAVFGGDLIVSGAIYEQDYCAYGIYVKSGIDPSGPAGGTEYAVLASANYALGNMNISTTFTKQGVELSSGGVLSVTSPNHDLRPMVLSWSMTINSSLDATSVPIRVYDGVINPANLIWESQFGCQNNNNQNISYTVICPPGCEPLIAIDQVTAHTQHVIGYASYTYRSM